MTDRILMEATPFGLRAALFRGETALRLVHHFDAQRGWAGLGQVFAARVTGIDKRLGAAFLDLGETHGFLRRPGPLPTIGTRLVVEVRREPLGGKGPDVSDRVFLRLPYVTVTPEGEMKPGPAGSPDDTPEGARLAVEWHRRMGEAHTEGALKFVPPAVALIASLAGDTGLLGSIEVDRPDVARAVAPFVPRHLLRTAEQGEFSATLDEATDIAMSPVHGLSGGGRMVIEETEALTAIDLDLGQTDGQSRAGAGGKLLGAALDRLSHLAPLMGLGGQIVVDVPRGAIASPKIVRDRLARAFKPLGRVSVPAVTPEGVCVIIAPRPRPTIRERLTEASDAGSALAGRRWRDHAAAARAWRTCRAALTQDRTSRLRLRVSPRLAPMFAPTSPAIASLIETFGPRLLVETSETVAEIDAYDIDA